MRQVLFEIPGLGYQVHAFSLPFLAACLGALGLTAWRARREGLDPNDVYDLALWLIPGGVVGARAFFILQHPEVIHGPLDLFKIWQGGIVFYGCIVGGLIGSVIFWTRRRFPFLPMADAVAPSLALGLALGRVGCFLNGCCFGTTCDWPWALRFPAGSIPWVRHAQAGMIPLSSPSSLPIHPTQLYSVLDGLLLLVLLTAYFPHRRRDGEVMGLLMVTYPITRFLIEALRGDEGAFLFGLTMSQAISVALFVLGLATWGYLARRPLGRSHDPDRIAQTAGSGPHSLARYRVGAGENTLS